MSLLSQNESLFAPKLEEFLSLTSLSPSNKWSKAVQKDSLTIHTHKDSKGVTMIRSEGSIPFPKEKVFSILWEDFDALKKVDDSIASYEIKERAKDGSQVVVHSKLKPAPMVTPRDMMLILKFIKEENRYIIWGTSIRYPENKDYVRAQCKVWGWILSEDMKKKGTTYAINVNYTDLAGRIPSFVVKPVLIKEHGYLITRASNYLRTQEANNNKGEVKPKL